MANAEYVAVLKKGVREWNALREEILQRNFSEFLDLTDAELDGINLRRADLRWVNLSRAHLHKADFIGADLRSVNLQGADLREALLSEANLRNATLVEANLCGSNLIEADFSQSTLTETNLSKANLGGAYFRQATLFRANLCEAKLIQTLFTKAMLDSADFSRALLGNTELSNTNLSSVIGLDSCLHSGPSILDYRTLLQSKILPPEFLQGCGIPLELQEALPKIMTKVKYYTCFISYGEPNIEVSRKLYENLKAEGISCWMYDKDSTPGERSWKEIGQQRRGAEKVITLCSFRALIRDGFLKEIEEQVDEDPDKLVPISLDDDWKESGFKVVRGIGDLKPFLLNRNYVDFAKLSFEEALRRLLKGLRRKEVAAGNYNG